MENLLKVQEKKAETKEGIISILERVQKKYGYLAEEALKTVSQETGISLVDIYSVATFYRYFSLKPRGKHLISACLGTACHVRQGPVILKEFGNQLGIKAGETTTNDEFSLETVNCLGACARGPMVVVDGHYFSNVKKNQVRQIVEKVRYGLERIDIKKDKRIFPVQLCCPKCNHSIMDPDHLIDDYPSIRLTISFNREHGWFRLSSLYGSDNFESEYNIPMDAIMNFFCPHCHAELISASSCPSCNAPMVPMIIHGSGMVQICSRRGCKNHMIDLTKTICVNCENRISCILTKSKDSVWHCEEYR